MTKYRIHIRAVMYPDFDSIYKYGQRISDPSRFGKVLGDVYSDMLDIPDINKNIDAEIDEATEYYTQSLSKARNTFQIHFNNILKKKPQNIEDINMINYTYQDGDNMTVIIVDVDYHDGADNVIEVTDSNVDDYFNVERVFKQEIVKSYHETEPDVYRLYDDDYFYRKNPFPDVYGREFDDDAVMGCRNFTFQVTEDCNLRCFAAGTMILMADLSKKPIERIVVGDEVLGFYRNEFDQIAFKKATVKRLFTNTARVITLTTPTGDTLVTPSHELYTSKGEYVKAALVRDAVNDLVMVEPYREEKSVRPDVTIISPAEYNIDKKTLFNDPVQVYNISTETGNYIANDICVKNCSYCYQTNKCATIMDIETAKSAVDDLLAGAFDYLSPGFSKSVILEFIGGDPLLEIDMIGEIYSYFLKEAYRLNHPWFRHNRISICSNGLLYFSKPSKKFFDRYAKETSFNISIDGNKSLHDACRIQPTGEGSYDIGIYGVHHSHDVYGLEISSKMTLAPSNIPMIKESVKNLCIDDNYPGINLNVVFEDVWQQKDARVLYDQLVGVADMVLKENRPDLYFSIFRNTQQIDPIYDVTTEMTGSCGGSSASMLSLSPQGIYYPCIRYMPSSLNGEMDALELGNTKDKMIENLRMLREFQMITRLTDQNDRCLSCPINHSCTDCTGLCYQTHGTANQRLYFICEMIKAEYLASIYYWGKLALKYPEFEIKTDTELAEYYQFENIISHDEYDELSKIVEQNVDRMKSMNLLD